LLGSLRLSLFLKSLMLLLSIVCVGVVMVLCWVSLVKNGLRFEIGLILWIMVFMFWCCLGVRWLIFSFSCVVYFLWLVL